MCMHFTCRLITPAMRSFRSGSCGASDTYGHTWAVESRSHMAFISPVITNVSGRPSFMEKLTVVSRVLGKQFEKSHASSLSAPRNDSISLIVSSTALLRNRRCLFWGLMEGHFRALPVANEGIPADSAAPATMLFMINFLRVDICLSFCYRFIPQRDILYVHLPYVPVLFKGPVNLDVQLSRVISDRFWHPAEVKVAGGPFPV